MAQAAIMAGRLRDWLRLNLCTALPQGRRQAELRRTQAGRSCNQRIHLRPGEASTLPRPSRSSPSATTTASPGQLARRRPARSLRPHRRRRLHLRRPHRPGQDQRPTHRQPHRLHQRHRLRLGRQGHRRLPRRGRRRTRNGWLPVHGLRRHLPRPLPGEPRKSQAVEPENHCNFASIYHRANHVFLPGHHIMVQVQSSWFPLYDRNPQTFVPNIFWAKPADYHQANQKIYSTSFIELPIVANH